MFPEQTLRRWKTTLDREEETGEGIATTTRRREMLLKKAKEYHKELDAVLVYTPPTPYCSSY